MNKPSLLAALLAATLTFTGQAAEKEKAAEPTPAPASEPASPVAKSPDEPAVMPAEALAKEGALTKEGKEKAALEARIRARLAQRALEKTTQPNQPATIAPAAAIPIADPVTTLPGVEVRGQRITEIDIKIRKLEKDIAREKKKIKSTDLDKSLNDPALTKSFSLFGGKSTAQRESVAADRVNLMEAERDLLENMKQARTPAEIEMLQQKINDLRELRRNLDTLYR